MDGGLVLTWTNDQLKIHLVIFNLSGRGGFGAGAGVDNNSPKVTTHGSYFLFICHSS